MWGIKLPGRAGEEGQRERGPGGVGRRDWEDWEDVAVMGGMPCHVSIKKLLCCPAVSGGLRSCVMC